MPPGILRNIFSYCLPYAASEKIIDVSEAPLLLTQICSHWRDLAINTPTIWSTIALKFPTPPRRFQSGYSNMFSRHIVDVEIDIEGAETSEALLACLAGAWRQKVGSLVSLSTLWLSRAEGCSLNIIFRDINSMHLSPFEKHESIIPVGLAGSSISGIGNK